MSAADQQQPTIKGVTRACLESCKIFPKPLTMPNSMHAPSRKEPCKDLGKIASTAERQVGLSGFACDPNFKCLSCSTSGQRILMSGNGFGFNTVAPHT